MMINWLKKRLTARKGREPRHVQLAEAIETLWQEEYDPSVADLSNLRSVYTADEAGQKRILHELGGYVEREIQAENLPIMVGMRKLELRLKDTALPMENALRRLGFSVSWEPLYARYDEYETGPYYTKRTLPLKLDGTWKVTANNPKLLFEGVFMTSRGKLQVYSLGEVTPEMQELLGDLVRKVKPLHIVWDGHIWEEPVVITGAPARRRNLDGTWRVREYAGQSI